MADWNKIKAEYIRSSVSYRKLAEKYGVPFSTLKDHALKEKWTDLRSQGRYKLDTKMIESVASREAKREDGTQKATDMLLQFIIDGIESGELLQEPRMIKTIASALKDIKDVKGSRLDIEEQKARIEKLRHDVQPESQEQKKIEVVISKDLIDYAG